MKKLIAALLLAIAFAAAPAPVTQPALAQSYGRQLSGEWRGVYFQGPAEQAVEFTAVLRERDGALTGSTLERNVFGDASSFWLFATVSGRVNGQTVSWAKTYDGTAGQSHTVRYEGRILSDRRIVGTWTLSGASGRFEMAR